MTSFPLPIASNWQKSFACASFSALYLLLASHTVLAQVAPEANSPPEIRSKNLPAGLENQAYEFQLQAADAEQNLEDLQFTLLDGPVGLILDASGMIRWQPDFNAAGSYKLRVSVSDAALSTEKTLSLKIKNNNRLPSIADVQLPEAKEAVAYSFDILASDADGESLKYRLFNEPKGMKLSAAQVQWTPNFNQAGEHSFGVRVSDGLDTVEKSFTLLVANNNRSPEYNGKTHYDTAENTPLALQLSAKDADADSVIFQLLQGPMGLAVSSEGELTWTASFEQAGSHTVKLQLSDAEAEVAFNININVAATNRAPQWLTQSFTPAIENTPWQLQLEVEDADKEDAAALQLRLKKSPQAMQLNKDGLLSWLPDFDSAGEHSIVLELSDGKASVEKIFSLFVANSNRAPNFISSAKVLAKEAELYHYIIQAKDADGDAVQITLLEGPKGMQLDINQLSFTAGFKQAGTYPVRLQLTDGDLIAEQNFVLQVENNNRPPVFSPVEEQAFALVENTPWQLSLRYSDADDEAMSISLLSGPEGLALNAQNELAWMPSFEQAGEYELVLQASDDIDITTQKYLLRVANNNRAPIFVEPALPLQAKEAQAWSLTLVASDADRQALSYELLAGPKGMQLQGDTLNWLPSYEQAGEHQVTVAVFDGEVKVPMNMQLQVENSNRAPSFTDAIITVLENQTYSYNIQATDADGDAVSLQILQMPEGMIFENKRLIFSPNFKQAGVYAVEILASDGDLEARQKFSLTVENVNRKPKILSQPKLAAHETLEYRYQVEASDADDEVLTMSIVSGPKNMEIVDGLISWTPPYNHASEQHVIVAVSDGIDITEQAFTIQVANANRAPVLQPIAQQKISSSEQFQYAVQASDPDGDKISYKLSHAPEAMTIDEGGKIIWLLNADDIGSHAVIVEASDGDLKQSKHFEITVHAAE